MKYLQTLVATTSLILIAASCSDTEFTDGRGESFSLIDEKENNGKKPGTDDAVSSTDVDVASIEEGDNVGDDTQDETSSASALELCSDALLEHVDLEQIENATTESVELKNNNNRLVHEHSGETEQVHIITVTAKNVNKGFIDLKNDSGVYCLNLSVKNMHKFEITRTCNAKVVFGSVSSHKDRYPEPEVSAPGCDQL